METWLLSTKQCLNCKGVAGSQLAFHTHFIPTCDSCSNRTWTHESLGLSVVLPHISTSGFLTWNLQIPILMLASTSWQNLETALVNLCNVLTCYTERAHTNNILLIHTSKGLTAILRTSVNVLNDHNSSWKHITYPMNTINIKTSIFSELPYHTIYIFIIHSISKNLLSALLKSN